MRRLGAVAAAACVAVGGWAAGVGVGAEVTCPVVKDGGFSFASGERNVNRGGKTRVRVKTYQEFMVATFDLSAIAGWTVTEAELHVRMASLDLYVADVSTIAVSWPEGISSGAALVGESCYDWRQYPADINNPAPGDWWAYSGSRFGDVAWGNGGTICSYAHHDDVTQQADSWRTIKISPDVVHGMALDQDGLVLCDSSQLHTNNDVYCREQSGSGPYLVVRGDITDLTAPSAVTNLGASTAGLWNGQVKVTWTAGGDDGAVGKAFGYDVRHSTSPINEGNFGSATPFPRYDMPRPAASGQSQQAWFEALTAGQTYSIAVKAYDEAGNRSALTSTSAVLPPQRSPESLVNAGWSPFGPAGSVPSFEGTMRVWVCEELIKVNPKTGNRKEDGYTGSGAEGYKKGNSVWDAQNLKVALQAARNEVAGFQLYLETLLASLTNVRVTVGDLSGPGGTISADPNVTLYRLWYAAETAGSTTYWASACLPFGSFFGTSFAIPTTDNAISGQTNQGVWVDVYVPTGTAAGVYTGVITIQANELSSPVQLGLAVQVRGFTVPDACTFVVDLNSYGDVPTNGASRENADLWHHQLAHLHRQTSNPLPYGQSGSLRSPYGPPISGTGLGATVSNWASFDSWVGKMLDGSAFTPGMGYYGPGMNTPVPDMYVVFHEDYPLDLQTYYQPPGQWALFDSNRTLFTQTFLEPEDATPAAYDETMMAIVKAFAEHFQAMGWTGTNFQFYLNNKYSATNHTGLWNLDEPTDYLDFAALQYYYDLFRDGVGMANAPDVRWDYRIDISTRYAQHKGMYDGRLDLMDASEGAWDDSAQLMARRKRAYAERLWWYGTGPGEAEWMTDLPAKFLQRWSLGADGGLPYWVTDYAGNKDVLETLAIFVQGGQWGWDHPLPSVRMKVMRQGEQVIEYLNLLGQQPGWDRAAATRALCQGYADVAGGSGFWNLEAADYHRLREDIATTIAAAGPPALVSSEPAADGTLPKTQNNVMLLTFDSAITLPGGAALTITSLPLPGTDVGGSFTYTIQPDGVTLKAKENGAVVTNLTWYRVAPAAGFGVQAFVRDFCTLQGDADANGQVLAQDYFPVKNNLFLVTDARMDLDGNGQVLAQDYFLVKNHLFDAKPAKP